jgi:hypothetical protein
MGLHSKTCNIIPNHIYIYIYIYEYTPKAENGYRYQALHRGWNYKFRIIHDFKDAKHKIKG